MLEVYFESDSPAQTAEFGQKLGERLQGGDVVLLKGDLGAGKTALAKGIAKGLGVEQTLTSPTFTLIQEYPVRQYSDKTDPLGENGIVQKKITLVHMDLYRLHHPEEAEVIGVEEHFQPDKVCVIEWPEVAEEFLPEDALTVELAGSGDERRRILVFSRDSGWEARLGTINK